MDCPVIPMTSIPPLLLILTRMLFSLVVMRSLGGLRVWTNSIAVPGYYSTMTWYCNNTQYQVISPWYCVLDLAIPLAIRHSTTLVCCHVPGHYLTNAPEPRRAMLRSLAGQKRLHVVMSPHRSGMGMRCLWIVIARDSDTLLSVLRPGIGLV